MPGRTISVTFLGNTRELEAALERAGIAAEVSGKKIGESFSAGTSKAGGALSHLSSVAAGFGLPFTESLDRIGKKLEECQTKTARFSTALAEAGKVTLTAGLAGFAAAAYEGVKGAVKLQGQMHLLHTQAGASTAEVEKMTKAVLGMAGSVGTGPQTLAESLYYVESSGLRGAQALDVLRVAAEGAKVGHADLKSVTDALSAAIVSGINGAQNYQQAMGALNSTVGAGEMTMQDMADALGTGLLAPMKVMGLSIKDVGAALALFGDNSIRGADAATKLRQAVLGMATPTAAADKWLKAIGMSSLQMANDMRSGGLLKALGDLKAHMQASKATAAQQGVIIANIFGRKAQIGVDLMLTQMDRLKDKYNQVGAGSNSFSEAWKSTTHTLSFQMDQLKATVTALGDKLGMFLIPKIQAMAAAIKDAIDWLGKHKAVADALAVTIGTVLGGAIAAFATQKAKAFVRATGEMISGIGKLAGGITSAVATIAAKLGIIGTTSTATASVVATSDAGMEASNAGAAGSFAGLSGAAAAATGAVETQVGGLAASVESADSRIEAANAAAGASFTRMLGPIGLVATAVAGIAWFLNKYGTPDSQAGTVTGGNGQQYYNPRVAPFANGGAVGNGNFLGPGLGNALNTIGGTVGHLTGGTTEDRIAAYFAGQGFSKVAIAGILGNWQQESGLNPSAPGGGLAQWIGPRWNALAQFAHLQGKNPNDLGVQLQFADNELRGSYHGAFNAIQNAKSPADAARLFSQLYEMPGVPMIGNRMRYAQQAFAYLGGGGGGGGNPADLNALLGGSGNVSPDLAALLDGSRGKAKHGKSHVIRTIRSLLYADPFHGDSYSLSRTDQGQDYASIRGNIGAVGAGVITLARNLAGFGQTIVERLTQGPNAGKSIYYGLETGATGVGIREGQRVAAGQTIARGLGTGAVEFGFWDQAHGRSAGFPYFTGNNATPPGQAFFQWMRQLAASGGQWTTTNLQTGQTTGGGSSLAYTLGQLEQAFVNALTKAAGTLAQKLGNAIQNGTPRTLEAALGMSTSTMVSTTRTHDTWRWGNPWRPFSNYTERQPLSALIADQVHGLGGTASISQIDKTLVGTVGRGIAGSQQERQFEQLVANLRAVGQGGLADKLVAIHKAAMATLAQELYALQVTKDAESLNLQATQLKDQTQAIADAAKGQLDILKAQYQKVNDAAQAQVTAIRDMTQTITDMFAGMVQSVTDATQRMTDAASMTVQGIQDQTQVQVDVLGERGLYGLNLVAQKLQVQLDVQKAADDRAIGLQQMNLDAVTAQWHAAVSNAQIAGDQLNAQQNALVAQAQQRSDTVAIRQAVNVASAQARVDAEMLHRDVAVVGPAQIAVDLNATAPRAQQDVYGAQLRRAQGSAGFAEAIANQWLTGVQDAANAALAQSAQSVVDAQNTAALLTAQSQRALASVQGQAQMAIAQAQQGLASAQSSAQLAEAPLAAGVAVTKAQASTQFAGSGLQVNIYGADVSRPDGIRQELDWFARTALK